MQDLSTGVPAVTEPTESEAAPPRKPDVVSTHVLVPMEQVKQLKDLSKKTRVAQSEYLREAVDDLLDKYGRKPQENL
jgi:hypothetical protein